MVLPDSRRITRVLRYSGTHTSQFILRLPGFHRLRPAFPCRSTPESSQLTYEPHNPQRLASPGLGYSPFARRYSENRICFLLLRVLRCFSSPGWPRNGYVFTTRWQDYPAGFPHSEISGSPSVSDSPELIAAVHVLHSLPLPRHPPYALSSLTVSLRHASNHSHSRSSNLELRKTSLASINVSGLPSYSIIKDPSRLPRGRSPTTPLSPATLDSRPVELIGFEPTTSGLQSQRSPS